MNSYRYTRFLIAFGWLSVFVSQLTDFIWFKSGGWGEAPETYGLATRLIPWIVMVWSTIGIVLPLLHADRSRLWVRRHLWGSLGLLAAGMLFVWLV